MGILLLWYVIPDYTLTENVKLILVGFAGVVWFAAWILLVFNSPADHPRISAKEQDYIESSIQDELFVKQSSSSKV